MTPSDLLAWRKRMGWSQSQAAAALRRTKSWMSKAERGTIKTDYVLELACEALEKRRHFAQKFLTGCQRPS